MATNCLPEAIIFYEILTRLSNKHLIRTTLVCKRWLSLIKKPGPINSQLVHSLHLNNSEATSLVVQTQDLSSAYTSDITVLNTSGSISYNINHSAVEFCDKIFRFDPSIVDVFLYPACGFHVPERLKLLDSVYGLVCLTHNYALMRLFIWNPMTSFFRTVLKPWDSKYYEFLMEDAVFFYDPVKGEMKILYIVLVNYKTVVRVYVYSFKTECWKEIEDERLPVAVERFKTMHCVKSRPSYGYVHFLFKDDESVDLFLAFDFDNEVFTQLPSLVQHFDYRRHKYVNWMDSLGMVGLNDSGERVIYTLDDISGTWYEKYVVPHSLEGYELELCLNNGDIVFQDSEKNLLLLEAEDDQFKTLIDLKAERGRFKAIPYTGSLLCIKGMQEISRKNDKKAEEQVN